MEIEVRGPRIFTYIGDYPLTETIVFTWLSMFLVIALCIWLTHGMKKRGIGKKQVIAEMMVNSLYNLIETNMGPKWRDFAPFIGSILCISTVASMLSLVGIYSPTNDLSTFLAWSICVFVLITYHKFRANGFLGYFKTYAQPTAVMTPMNLISEIATPVSMAFRHYGNILSGYIVGLLLYGALGAASQALLGGLPGILGDFPLLQIGVPAVLNLYFTVFSGCLQPFIFSMLTMIYVSSAAETD